MQQPAQETPQQRRTSSHHSRHPTSPSSIGTTDPAQQHAAAAVSVARPVVQRQGSIEQATSAPATQLTKLDGVIYHFYTTTANLVIQSRLAHLRSFLLTAPYDTTAVATAEHKSAQTTVTPAAQTKLSRWFGLHIPDSDLFKDELRLWRSVTSLLGPDANNHDQPAPTCDVPDLILDVMLDLSGVSGSHEILLLTRPSLSTASQPTSDSAGRIRIDGHRPEQTSPPSSSFVRPSRIVLEQWRLRFDPSQPSAPPDLSTFYKRSVVHFRSLFTLLCSLPSNRLAGKIESLKAAAQHKRVGAPQPAFPSRAARSDMGTHDAEMNLGCRLSMDLDSQDIQSDPAEISVTQPLPAERDSNRFTDRDAEEQGAAYSDPRSHFATRTLAPIATPIGFLELSVTYRKWTDFLIEDAAGTSVTNDIKVDLDEDYFRAPRPSTTTIAARTDDQQRSAPQFSVSAQQRVGGISAARPAILAAQKSSPDSATGLDTLLLHSSANPSVFSTSAPGRQAAGLSSLRRTGSTKSNLSLIGPGSSSAVPSSPALAAALSVEPAFTVPSSVRRPSTSERRLRTLSGLSSGRPSPPVSPAAASFDLPEAGTSLPRSASAAYSSSLLGRSISTRTASGFAANAPGTMGPPSSTQPRTSVSFSPSSPSPLAQQMSLQASRSIGGAGLAPTISQSTASFRSVSGSGLRSSTSGAGVLPGPSLRSVFQTYVPRSQSVSVASMTRTPPTTTSGLAHGSYSPSNLGTGMRGSSIRRNSSTSDAGSGSAFGASVASSSGAKPQMIKRYSTNFSYRQNRERAAIYGSSLGSEGSGSLGAGAGAEPSSYPRFGGAGGSLSSAYGRSWISRMEQRQGLGTGGAFARTSSLDDATAAATASVPSRYRPLSAAAVAHMGEGLTPSPRSHEDDMDDLIRLLETRPAFGASSMGKLTSLRTERRNAPGLSSTPEEGAMPRGPGHGTDTLTDSVQSNLGQDRPSPLSGSGLRPGSVLRTANPMSRSQLDDLLNRMAESVGILETKEQASAMGVEARPDIAASHDGKAAVGASAPATQQLSAPRPLTPAQISATLGKGRGSLGKEVDDHASSRLSSPGTFARALPGEAGVRPRSSIGHQVRAYVTAAGERATSSSDNSVDPVVASIRDEPTATMPSTTSSAGGAGAPPSALSDSQQATRMPDYEAEGDLIFKVDGQQDYDPQDELPGEMEMMPEERSAAATATRPSSAVTATLAGGVEGGMGATLPVGAHREGRAHDWHAADRWQRERAQEAERRRADAEMSRNFGQEVGASTRGRGSHSPWRASVTSVSQQQPAAITAVGEGTATAGAGRVGFRSSSTRPFIGTNRLVSGGAGVGIGAAGFSPGGSAGSDGRRSYGVSAPSTQLYHQPRLSKAAAQSYPASRDGTYDDDVDAEEEED